MLLTRLLVGAGLKVMYANPRNEAFDRLLSPERAPREKSKLGTLPERRQERCILRSTQLCPLSPHPPSSRPPFLCIKLYVLNKILCHLRRDTTA